MKHWLENIGVGLKRVPGWGVLLLVMFFYFALSFQYFRCVQKDWSGFICLGDRFKWPSSLTEGKYTFKGTPGYDGQFFYLAALDPFISKGYEKYMDVPAYRYQRITYPLIAWALALGKGEFVPFTLVLTNWLAILCCGLFSIALLKKNGFAPIYSFSFLLCGAFVLCLLRDLSGIVSVALILGFFHFKEGEKLFLSTLCLALAILAREIFLPVAILWGALSLLSWKKNKGHFFCSLISLLIAFSWQAFLYFKIGRMSFRGGQSNFGPFLKGIRTYGEKVFNLEGSWALKGIVLLTFVLILCSLFLSLYESIRRRDLSSLSFLGYSVMPLLLTQAIWVEPWSFSRVLLPLYCFLFINFCFSKHSKWYFFPLLVHLFLCCFIVLWVGLL